MSCSFFDGPKGVPLVHYPNASCSPRPCLVATKRFALNSCCDQGLSVSYSLASKSGVMLSSWRCASQCPEIHGQCPEIYISGHFALSAPTLRRKGQFSSRLVHHVCFACPSNCPITATIGLRTAENECLIIHGVPKWMPRPIK